MATEPMQEAVQRALRGEPVYRVAKDMGLPESSVRWNVGKARKASLPPAPPESQIASQIASQLKTAGPYRWVEDARVIRDWLLKAIALRLQEGKVPLRDLVVTFGVISDKVHQAEGLLSTVQGSQVTAEARVVIYVQEGGKVMPLEEFVGDPPALPAPHDDMDANAIGLGERKPSEGDGNR